MADPQLPERAASLGARALALATRLAAVRPAAKPLHPRGDVVAAELRRDGGQATGSPWLDLPGRDQVVVRRSRAVGLPEGWPDIHGLAIRVPIDESRFGDLLLATTGHGRVTRFLLAPARRLTGTTLTTLLPYRTPTGPVVIGARAADERRLVLAWAPARGDWVPFGEVALADDAGPDPLVSFDPVRNQLPGLDNYEWVRRLREPAYLTARRTRSNG
jgi:hypothetical protein